MFSDKELLPIEWLSDWTFVGTSGVCQGQIRYSYGFSKDISASFGIEAPYSDVTTTAGVSYPDSNGGGGFGWQLSPDFTGGFCSGGTGECWPSAASCGRRST